ncbi:hypothetical protein ARMSODRAFT_1003811 [Armillaria solidipes]|uniref:Uncharacterized protein n=1 Tax=Armillaria solidipes TaxID=1076256 RepID=A0A2H3BTD0_9AGAR|nr:hypothetical protein ARMSODRAFT_1003811 [Armillaria solidipes]
MAHSSLTQQAMSNVHTADKSVKNVGTYARNKRRNEHRKAGRGNDGNEASTKTIAEGKAERSRDTCENTVFEQAIDSDGREDLGRTKPMLTRIPVLRTCVKQALNPIFGVKA